MSKREAASLRRLLLATGNPGKLRELRELLSQAPVEVFGLGDLEPRPEEVPETADTFIGNAVLKAVGYGQGQGVAALADDSGLVVDALDGAPGVWSARFAGVGATDRDNNELLLEKLSQVPDEARTARFRCALALYVPPGEQAARLAQAASEASEVDALGLDGVSAPQAPESEGVILATHGVAEGRILRSVHGEGGFGYDPLFLSDDLGVTFAQSHGAKAGVSHRGRALSALVPWLLSVGAL